MNCKLMYWFICLIFLVVEAVSLYADTNQEKDLDADGLPGLRNFVIPQAQQLNAQSTEDLLANAWSNSNCPVYKIDSQTGSGIQIGLSGFGRLNSMARDDSGTIYSVGGLGDSALVTIDTLTGVATQIATINLGVTIGFISALAWSPTGELFAIHSGATIGIIDELYTIDVSTGLGTLIGGTGYEGIQAMDFSPSGQLYAWDVITDGLLTIDKTTGIATDVNPLVGADFPIQSITFLSDGTLLGARNALFSIDIVTGECTQIGSGNYSDVRGIQSLDFQTTGGIISLKHESLPKYRIYQNSPNPFNPTTNIHYLIGSKQRILLRVYDLLGKEIATLVNEEKPAGEYTVEFDASKLSSGIYFYQLQAGDFIEAKKMILMR